MDIPERFKIIPNVENGTVAALLFHSGCLRNFRHANDCSPPPPKSFTFHCLFFAEKKEKRDIKSDLFTISKIEFLSETPAPLSRYRQLLSDVHLCYLHQREHLLGPSITSTVTELTKRNNRDHCALVKSCFSPFCIFLCFPFF